MARYKHKYSNDIAELVNSSGYKLNKSTIGLIPKEYIEKSNDWEKVEDKPILITEDGKEILEGDTVYVTNIQANFLSNHSVTKDSIFKNSAFKYFAKKENMDRYIEENKPMYSRKEVRDFGGYILRNLKGVMPMKLLFELWLREKGN